jgi:hypothetical protein
VDSVVEVWWRVEGKEEMFSSVHPLVRLFVRSFVRPSVRTFVRSFVRQSVRSFVRPPVRPFIRSFVQPFVRSLKYELDDLLCVALVYDVLKHAHHHPS